MFESSQHENTPLLSRQFITTTHRYGPAICSPRVFFRTIRGCIIEFCAMTLLMFIGALCMRDVTSDLSGSILLVGIGNGFSYGVLVAATMHISGGFVNPAVTLGVMVAGKLHVITGLCYIVMHILGAVSGAGLVSLYSEGTINAAVHHLHSLPAKDDIDAATVLLAILYEALTTSVLVLVALHAAIDKGSKVKPAAPVVLGFSVTVGILATFHFTGGSVNPAKSLGPAVIGTKDTRWDYHYIYWVGPMIGATVTALLYRLFFAWNAWIPAFKQREEDEEKLEKTSIN